MIDFKKIISQKQADAAFLTWINNIDSEVQFWDDYIRTGGLDYPSDYQARLDNKNIPCGFGGYPGIQSFLKKIPQQHIKILDVGSGPMTLVGHKAAGKTVEVTACDPLASAYSDILNKYNIQPPVKVIFADCENLSLFFDPDYFDLISCRNALDHSYNPIQSILQMLFLVKKNGLISLAHFANEAENCNYTGLHQWNLSNEGDDLIIWNRENKFSLQEILGNHAVVKATISKEGDNSEKNALVLCTIEKKEDFSGEMKALFVPDLHHKYKMMMSEFVKNKQIQSVTPEPIVTPKPTRLRRMKRRLLAALGFKRYKKYATSR